MSSARRLIESDAFPFETLSVLAEKESWRKEVHRPIYHVHKWWAKRLGSVFRGALLGCALPEDGRFEQEFDRIHDFSKFIVFDPFMGSGTTVGEAHKLGFTALGRDINPIAAESVRVALGTIRRKRLLEEFNTLNETIGREILDLYRSTDSDGNPCQVLYYFWVMRAACPACDQQTDLFSSYVLAKNAYPKKKPEIKVVCPSCGGINDSLHGSKLAQCVACNGEFNPMVGNARGSKATCSHCKTIFSIQKAVAAKKGPPKFRLYAKLVLRDNGDKQYLAATDADIEAYKYCQEMLRREVKSGLIRLPETSLDDGYNTRQAIGYGFRQWREFFNARQLLALAWLERAISRIDDPSSKDALLALFSGVLEFNNMFASYKGEGTGAVRHMFAHHILKPERIPIEANIWGTPKSSGAFSTLFRSRLLRAVDYKEKPADKQLIGDNKIVVSKPLTRPLGTWPGDHPPEPGAVHLSCGDSSQTGLPDASVDFVVTDPPFFDNVHYSELADFFYAWQQLSPRGFIQESNSTRSKREVQDTEVEDFSRKLTAVLTECHRVLKDEGLLVFSYHHSRNEGWSSVAVALLAAGFRVVNAQPVKAEMSVATPKAQAKEPIQLDIMLVCRKIDTADAAPAKIEDANRIAATKIQRLIDAGFKLSTNDLQIIKRGQLLTTICNMEQARGFGLDENKQNMATEAKKSREQLALSQ